MDYLFDSNGSQSEIDDIDIEQLCVWDSSDDDLQEEEQSDDQLNIK
jgi:hypothetical protein